MSWSRGDMLSIKPFGKTLPRFSFIEMQTFSFSVKKCNLKMSSPKWWPFCHGFNVLTHKYRRENVVHTTLTTDAEIGRGLCCRRLKGPAVVRSTLTVGLTRADADNRSTPRCRISMSTFSKLIPGKRHVSHVNVEGYDITIVGKHSGKPRP